MTNSINTSTSPPSNRSDIGARVQFPDDMLSKAWNDHIQGRRAMLSNERTSCISEDDYHRRIGTLASSKPKNWELTRKVLSEACRAEVSNEDLDWRDNFSRASILLESVSQPANVPAHAGRSLLESRGDLVLLADDALVLGSVNNSSGGIDEHVLWVQWKDEAGEDAAYLLTIAGIESADEGDEPGLPSKPFTVDIERLDLSR